MFKRLFSAKRAQKVQLEVPVAEFIPYACHVDPKTLITRNGELLQIIKITGFFHERVGVEQVDLRDVIRKAVREHVQSDDFSLWLTTIRKRYNLDPGGEYKDGFSRELNAEWKGQHRWEDKYVNELYIAVIQRGFDARMLDVKGMFRALSPKHLLAFHRKHIKDALESLTQTTTGLLSKLEGYGARILSVKESDDGPISEQLSFLHKILHFEEKPIPLAEEDIADYLSTHQIAFGYNSMEVIGDEGKHFGAMFTIKEYHEVDGDALDALLQLPLEFIITQTLDFVNRDKVLGSFKELRHIAEISGADHFAERLGLDEILQSDTGSPTDYGESQITILVLGDDVKSLEHHVVKTSDALSSLGMVATRRDLRLEECFWAQLPANFAYISRHRYVHMGKIGGFASLYNFPAGKRDGNLWGPAVTLFYTAKHTPYFFNFHVKDHGHTAIIGPEGSGKTVLMNFLLAESRKYQGRLFFFDQDRASKVFISAIGGHYTIIDPEVASAAYGFNPLLIEDNEVNRVFLRQWVGHLAASLGEELSEEDLLLVKQALDRLFQWEKSRRRLSSFVLLLPEPVQKKLSPWVGEGKYAHLFDNNISDIVSLDGMIYGFGMSRVIKDKVSLIPILSYLFHCIEMQLDGTPTIIVLDEAWNLVNNSVFAPQLTGWLERLKRRNTVVIFATESIDNTRKTDITKVITSHIATQIFLPNKRAMQSSRAYNETWGLSSHEFELLADMNKKLRHFLLKQAGEAVVAKLDLAQVKAMSVLSGSDETVTIMDQSVAECGKNVEKWLPKFYEKLAK